MTYFEFEDARPGEDELQWILDKIFVSTAGGISIPKEFNQNILQFFVGERFAQFRDGFKKGQNDC
jgi:hypothetical protein